MHEEAPREPSRETESSRTPSSSVRIDLATVLAHTPEYIGVLDDRGRVRFTNHLPPGATTEEVVGWPITKWMTPSSRPKFEASLREALAAGREQVFEMEGLLTGKIFETTLWPIASGEGRARAVVLSAHDVSDRRRLERELRRVNRTLTVLGDLRGILLEVEDEARLFDVVCERTLLEGPYSGLWIGSMEHDALAKLLHRASGGDLADALRTGDVRAAMDGPLETSPVAEAEQARAPIVLEEEHALRFVSRHWSGPARTRTRRAAIVPICDGPHLLALAIVTSANPLSFRTEETRLLSESAGEIAQAMRWMRARSERRLLIEQLVHSQKMEAIGRLAAGIAHDFNNQLTSILGFADMLTVELEDETLREQAGNIVRAAERSAYLVAQLLAFARKGPFVETSVDVRAMLTDLVEILERSLDKRIAVQLEWDASLRYVDGDAQQLENALLNLAINARDAMPTGGTIRFVATDCAAPAGAVDESAAQRGAFLCVDVIDEGVGMDAETQKRIFEPFFTTKPPGEGTGLGLSAVYGTVQRHRGFVEVDSSPGQGSRFRVMFPARRDPPARPTERTATRQEPSPGGRPRRILVIDDEPLVGALVVSGLRGHGYDVDATVTPEAGIAQFQENPASYDLVLVDMVMPRVGGGQVFHALRILRPDVPVLLMSGYSIDHESEALLEQGASGFLQKPFTVRDLIRAIGETFARLPEQHPG